jgi:hypothetical protein
MSVATGKTGEGATAAETAEAAPPKFLSLFWNSPNKVNLCTLTILVWLSRCDGTMSPEEEAFLRRTHQAGETGMDFQEIRVVARAGRLDDMEVACRYVSTHFSKEQKRLLARLAIMLTAQDGVITVGENYCLQFIADLTGIKPGTMGKLFEEVTHRPFPEAGDPSSVQWWRRREAGVQAEAAKGLGPQEAEPGEAGEAGARSTAVEEAKAAVMTRVKAMAILGLSQGATAEMVKSAFRRLAKARHPDRFVKLGPSAVAAATESFKELEGAYAMLKV